VPSSCHQCKLFESHTKFIEWYLVLVYTYAVKWLAGSRVRRKHGLERKFMLYLPASCCLLSQILCAGKNQVMTHPWVMSLAHLPCHCPEWNLCWAKGLKRLGKRTSRPAVLNPRGFQHYLPCLADNLPPLPVRYKPHIFLRWQFCRVPI